MAKCNIRIIKRYDIRMSCVELDLIKKSLKNNGRATITLQGESMTPLISSGTKVEMVSVRYPDIKVSDIIAFVKNKRFIVHQCIYKERNNIVTWGVNNNFTDGKVAPQEIVGRAKFQFNTSIYNQLLLFESKNINRKLTAIKSKPIWIKGPVYDLYLYGYLKDGRMPDLDIIIDRKTFRNVKICLEQNGYTMAKKRQSAIDDIPYAEVGFKKKIGEYTICVDVHLLAVRCTFRNFYTRPFSFKSMITLNDELVVNKKKFDGYYILDDTASLIHLCLNLMLHHAGSGMWEHARIAQLIKRNEVDWELFIDIANRYQVSSYIYFPLIWVKNIFGVKSPIINKIRPNNVKLLFAKLAINRFTTCKTVRLKTWLDHRKNNIVIFYLRLVLSS